MYMYLVLSRGAAESREKGSESVRAAEKERAGSGIPRLVGSERKRKNTQHCVIFCNRDKAKRWWEPTIGNMALG